MTGSEELGAGGCRGWGGSRGVPQRSHSTLGGGLHRTLVPAGCCPGAGAKPPRLPEPDEPRRAKSGQGMMPKGAFPAACGCRGDRRSLGGAPAARFPACLDWGPVTASCLELWRRTPSSLKERHSARGWVNRASGHVSPLCGSPGPKAEGCRGTPSLPVLLGPGRTACFAGIFRESIFTKGF